MNSREQNPEQIRETILTEYSDDYLLLHLREKILPELIRQFPDGEVVILDFGCGDGRIISWTAAELGEQFPQKTIQAWGYDRFLDISEKTQDRYKRYAKRRKIPELQWTNTVEDLPKKINCALFHFSMHHMAKTRETLDDEIAALTNSLNMSSVIIAEYDFVSEPCSIENFLGAYLATDAGKKEFPQYNTTDECFADHTRFEESDYLDALQKAGFTIIKRIKSNIDVERYNFILAGTRRR